MWVLRMTWPLPEAQSIVLVYLRIQCVCVCVCVCVCDSILANVSKICPKHDVMFSVGYMYLVVFQLIEINIKHD
jgi:hypothetical protein